MKEEKPKTTVHAPDKLALPFPLHSTRREPSHAEIGVASRTTARNPPPRLKLFRRPAAVCGARRQGRRGSWMSGLQEAHQHDEPIPRSSSRRCDARVD